MTLIGAMTAYGSLRWLEVGPRAAYAGCRRRCDQKEIDEPERVGQVDVGRRRRKSSGCDHLGISASQLHVRMKTKSVTASGTTNGARFAQVASDLVLDLLDDVSKNSWSLPGDRGLALRAM